MMYKVLRTTAMLWHGGMHTQLYAFGTTGFIQNISEFLNELRVLPQNPEVLDLQDLAIIISEHQWLKTW